MKLDRLTQILLAMAVVFLAVIVFRPVVHPPAVKAQGDDVYPFFVEPGYTMLRKPDGSGQMLGKMMIDMRTGDIWGFPTLVDGPYPVDTAKPAPPKSHPMYLGQFVLRDATR